MQTNIQEINSKKNSFKFWMHVMMNTSTQPCKKYSPSSNGPKGFKFSGKFL